jgi:hypothetical protein
VTPLLLRRADSPYNKIRHTGRRIRQVERRASYTLETPQALLPSPGRKIRVARNKETRQWMLVIGPDVSRATLKARESAARESDAVRGLQRGHDDLLEHAAALEAEAKAVRENARTVQTQVTDEVRKIVGPVHPFTETYTFKCDDQTDAEFLSLNMSLPGMFSQVRGPSGGGGGWTKIGSADWLEGLFPGWNTDEAAPPAAVSEAAE